MKILFALEHGPIDLTIGAETRIRRDVLSSAFVNVRTDRAELKRDGDRYGAVRQRLVAGSVAGLIPLTPDRAVLVSPRYPVSLTEMVSKVGGNTTVMDALREYGALTSDDDAEDWMLDRLAPDLVDRVEQLVSRGILRTYVERRYSTSSPKGRILVGPTLSRWVSRGVNYKADVAFFERSGQNAPNQLIHESLFSVLSWIDHRPANTSGLGRGLRNRVVTLLGAFDYMTRDQSRSFKNDLLVRRPTLVPSSREAYREVIPLALALLEQRGFSLDSSEGDMALRSLLVETDQVFEEYVRTMLEELLGDRSLSVLDGNKMRRRLLYSKVPDDRIPSGAGVLKLPISNIQPDILIEDAENRTRLVLDVKYQAVENQAQRAAVEQLVTYCHKLGCSRAVSIHPAVAGQRSGLYAVGRIGATDLYTYRVDLGAADLAAEMGDMALALGSLV